MKIRINVIIGLLLMMVGLFSLVVLLTSCSKEEVEEVVSGPNGYIANNNGTQTTSGGATARQDSISHTSMLLNCVLIGMTDEFCEGHGYDIYEYDFKDMDEGFYFEDGLKQGVKEMFKNNKATGASYVWIYGGEQKLVLSPNAEVKYNIIWKSRKSKE